METTNHQLRALAAELPDTKEMLTEALLLQLQATRAAAQALDIEVTNVNCIKLASDQAAKLVSLIEVVAKNIPSEAPSEALDVSFTFDDTNYQPVDPSALEDSL